jgi:hypothetical protein
MSWIKAIFIFLIFSLSGLADQMLVIPLSYRSPEEVIQTLEPFFKGRVVLAPYGDKIIARTQPEDIRELKSMIARLDQKLRSVRIHFRTEGASESEQTQAGVRVSSRDGASISVSQRANAANQNGVQTVTTTEGSPARLNIAQGSSQAAITVQVRTVGSTTAFVQLTHADSGVTGLIATGSTVSGPLGAWIALSGSSERTKETGGHRNSERRAYVKIDLL